jgi:hypothetical protein
MPASPKKCWGKKVKFTPINIVINWIFRYILFNVRPVNRGYQFRNPAIIANTAPIERT